MIEELFFIEKQAYQSSFIHMLDARVKIVLAFAAIIAIISVPYSTMVYSVGAIFFLFFAILWIASRLPVSVYCKRLAAIVPIWGIIIVFQIFLKNRYYTSYDVLYSLPFGINIYSQSVEFACILAVKFLVSISFIILLSSTTKLQDLLQGASRLGLPTEFTLALGMMIRYLFVFGYIYRKVNESLVTRCFDPFNRALPYQYRIRQLGYTIGTMFVRSYEQGERVYTSMLCRGYGRESHLFVSKKPLLAREWAFLGCCMVFLACVPVVIWLTSIRFI